jgi:hypothetical protein
MNTGVLISYGLSQYMGPFEMFECRGYIAVLKGSVSTNNLCINMFAKLVHTQ